MTTGYKCDIAPSPDIGEGEVIFGDLFSSLLCVNFTATDVLNICTYPSYCHSDICDIQVAILLFY